MAEIDLEAIRSRAEAATPGPWRVVIDDSESPTTVWRECTSPDHPLDEDPGRAYVFDDCRDGELHAEPFFREADAEFIAHARTDVPALLAEVDRLRTQLDKPCGECHPCANWPAETWRRAGQRLPDVYAYADLLTDLNAMRSVVEAARAWRSKWKHSLGETFSDRRLTVAVDAWEKAVSPDA